MVDLLMLTCGWVAGVITTLAIRHMLEERQPLDPALLPSSVPMPIAAMPALLPPPPQLSPYAPKPARLRTHEKHKLATRQKTLANPLVQHANHIIRDFRDCVG